MKTKACKFSELGKGCIHYDISNGNKGNCLITSDCIMEKRNSTEGLKHDTGKQPFYAMPLAVLKPLADVFAAGEKKYATFNCLKPFEDSSRRFYDGQMRHTEACQLDPLAIDEELLEQTGIEVYHCAQVAFNALLRLHNALMEKEKEYGKQQSSTNSPL